MIEIWPYVVNVYRQPGVREACLDLQDKGWDVPLLLFSGWYGQSVGVLSKADVAQLIDFTQSYCAAYVEPIRHMRQTMKHQPLIGGLAKWEAQREQVKEWELSAERFQLTTLSELVDMTQGHAGDAAIRINLELLSNHYGPIHLDEWVNSLTAC